MLWSRGRSLWAIALAGLIVLTAYPAYAVKVEFMDDIYDLLPMRSLDESWEKAISDLRENNTSKKSWDILQVKADSFEKYALSSDSRQKLSASAKAQVLALTDMISYIDQTGGSLIKTLSRNVKNPQKLVVFFTK